MPGISRSVCSESEIEFERSIDVESSTQKLIDFVYRLAVQPDQFATIFYLLRNAFRSTACGIFHHDFRTGEGWILPSAGFKLRFVALYKHEYSKRNPWLTAQAFGGSSKSIFTGEQLVLMQDLVQCDFYKKWLKPQGLFHWLAGILHEDESTATYFSALRHRGELPYNSEDENLMKVLLPHLRRGVRVYETMTELLVEQEASFEVLNHLPISVFCVDYHGQLLSSNALGREMLSHRDGVALKDNKLSVDSPSEMARLYDLLALAGNRPINLKDKLVGRLTLSRNLGSAPLNAVVLAVAPSRPALRKSSPAALVMVADPLHGVQANQNWLKSFYGLTPTEARIAALVADGLCLNEIAQLLGIGVGTVRTHLKRVFYKTGTSRQAQLVRLALSGPTHMMSEQCVPEWANART